MDTKHMKIPAGTTLPYPLKDGLNYIIRPDYYCKIGFAQNDLIFWAAGKPLCFYQDSDTMLYIYSEKDNYVDVISNTGKLEVSDGNILITQGHWEWDATEIEIGALPYEVDFLELFNRHARHVSILDDTKALKVEIWLMEETTYTGVSTKNFKVPIGTDFNWPPTGLDVLIQKIRFNDYADAASIFPYVSII